MTRRTLCIVLVAFFASAAGLWAADQSWRWPVPTLGGLSAGDIIVAVDANNLTNASRIRLLASTAPTCASNGCSAVVGNDSYGIFTRGGGNGSANPVTLTFNTAWNAMAVCVVQRQTGTAANVVQTTSTTHATMAVTVATGVTTGDTFAYQCASSG